MPTAMPSSLVAQAEALCDHGMYLQAQSLLPALQSEGTLPAMLAHARISEHLGARRKAGAQRIRLWRAHRSDAQACVAMARVILERRGPYRTWTWMRAIALDAESPAEYLAEWHSCRAHLLSILRDFEGAQEEFVHAFRLAPKNPWIWVEWAYVYEMRDRYQEAIATVQKALQIDPGYRPALQALAHLYTLVGRDSEAQALLADIAARLESAHVLFQQIGLLIEHERYQDAWIALERCERLMPMADKDYLTWFSSQRADIALRLGDMQLAREHALAAGGEFYAGIVRRLDEAVPVKRVKLPVGFVRQHHLTCAPATLSALSQFWGKPAEHLDIAEEICYDGTPYHSERAWAVQQGFIAREFTVDWDSACRLVDAGIPFTLTTVGMTSGHLQAVIGYDTLRGTLLIRDPFQRMHAEFDAASLFIAQRSTGPRGMILVPEEEAHRLESIDLPDAEYWDGYFAVMRALAAHDRASAVAEARALAAKSPDHRLSIWAARAICGYDGNEFGLLAQTERLLKLYPDEAQLLLSKVYSLGVVGTRTRQLECLATALEQYPNNPQLLAQYAKILSADFRDAGFAFRQVRRALAIAPVDAWAWSIVADLLWVHDRKADAVAHYRIAACLQDSNENLATSYFRAAHFVGHNEPALRFLEARRERLGAKTAASTITLCLQLEMLDRPTEAFAVLEKALTERPDDGELLLFAAERHALFGRLDKAQAALAAIGGGVKRSSLLRVQSRLARSEGRIEDAAALAREACRIEPLNLELQRLMASLLMRGHGRSAAQAYLREQCARFPHFSRLHEMLVEWLGESEPEEAEQVLRRVLEMNPAHPWAQRELAINLARRHQYEEAKNVARQAVDLAPEQSSGQATLGFVLAREGAVPEAAECFRRALRLSIDNDYALNALLGTCASLQERRAALDFVREEMVRQVTLGDVLLNFQAAARNTYTREELLAFLQEALSVRPDLWQAWAAVCLQHLELDEQDKALALVGQALERFPMIPRLHLEQARIYLLRRDHEAVRRNLRPALQIDPGWYPAVQMHVDSVIAEGKGYDDALALLDSPLARNPDDARMHALRASVLWKLERRDEAVKLLQHAVGLDPALEWAWGLLGQYGRELGRGDLLSGTALALTEQRPGDCQAWIKLAEYAPSLPQALEAADRALQLEPRNAAAYELRLGILLKMRRDDDIEAALRTVPWGAYTSADIRRFGPRLLWARGDRTGAIAAMRRLLDSDPNHFGLWQELADWYEAAGMLKEYADACSNLVRINPYHHVSHGYAGHAAQRLGQRAEALQHYDTAFRIDPKYGFAGLSQADMLLEDNELDRAAEVLARLNASVPGPYVAERSVRLAVLRKDVDSVRAPLATVLQSGPQEQSVCEAAMKAVRRAKWANLLEELIEQCMRDGRCSPAAAKHWLDEQGSVKRRGFYAKIRPVLDADPSHVLKRALLAELSQERNLPLLREFVHDYRNDLIANTDCWSDVAYAYLSYGCNEEVVKWMGNWRVRRNVPWWSLDNLGVALRNLGHHEEAREVALASLEKHPHNHDAMTWLATDEARAGRMEALEEWCSRIDHAQLRPYYQRLFQLMRAYADAVRTGALKDILALFSAFKDVRKTHAPLNDLMVLFKSRLVWNHAEGMNRYWRWFLFALR